MDAGARRAFARARRGVLAGEGAQLPAVDCGVNQDDVLGVDEPGGTGGRHGMSQVRDLAPPGRPAMTARVPPGRSARWQAGYSTVSHRSVPTRRPPEKTVIARAACPPARLALPGWPAGLAPMPRRQRPARAAAAASAGQPVPGTATRSPGRENAPMTGNAAAPGQGGRSGSRSGHSGPGTPGQMLSGRPVRPAVPGQEQAPGSGGAALPVLAAVPGPAGQESESGMRA